MWFNWVRFCCWSATSSTNIILMAMFSGMWPETVDNCYVQPHDAAFLPNVFQGTPALPKKKMSTQRQISSPGSLHMEQSDMCSAHTGQESRTSYTIDENLHKQAIRGGRLCWVKWRSACFKEGLNGRKWGVAATCQKTLRQQNLRKTASYARRGHTFLYSWKRASRSTGSLFWCTSQIMKEMWKKNVKEEQKNELWKKNVTTTGLSRPVKPHSIALQLNVPPDRS